MKYFILLILLGLVFSSGFCQTFKIPLWPDEVPNSRKTDEKEIHDHSDIIRIRNVQSPEIAVYLPSGRHATGQAVLICPGGGYHILAYDAEGVDVAKWFNSKGIAAAVLKYRLPISKSVVISHEAPLQDTQRALRLLRYHADEWNINKDQIGIIGFSAGGHLASTLGTKFDHNTLEPADEIDIISARPDFMILVYPVISFRESFSHQGSKNALLGENPSDELVDFFSNEMHVSSATPPAFIVHSGDDKSVPVENSLSFYQAMVRQGVMAEMHIYPDGGHGYSLAVSKGYLQTWTDRLYDWLSFLHREQ